MKSIMDEEGFRALAANTHLAGGAESSSHLGRMPYRANGEKRGSDKGDVHQAWQL